MTQTSDARTNDHHVGLQRFGLVLSCRCSLSLLRGHSTYMQGTGFARAAAFWRPLARRKKRTAPSFADAMVRMVSKGYGSETFVNSEVKHTTGCHTARSQRLDDHANKMVCKRTVYFRPKYAGRTDVDGANECKQFETSLRSSLEVNVHAVSHSSGQFRLLAE